jgi:hypothetical protein
MHESAAVNAIDERSVANAAPAAAATHKIGRGVVPILAMAAAIAAFFLLIVAWQFGSVANGIAAFQGYSVLPERATVSAGEVVPGQKATVAFRMRNLTSGEVCILGAQADCRCVAYNDLPMTLEAKSEAEMHVSFTSSRRDVGHTLRHDVSLYLDVNSPPVVLTAEATVIEHPEGTTTDVPKGS